MKPDFQVQATSTNLQQILTILKQRLQLYPQSLNQRLNQKTGPLVKFTMKSLYNYLLRYRSSKPMENISLTTILLPSLMPCIDLILIYGGKHFAMKLK